MVWTALELLPLESTAVHVRAMTFVAPQPLVVASLKLMVTEPLASLAVATPTQFVPVSAGHSNTTFVGQIMIGAVVSRTVIVCTALATLPQGSVAVHVREMTCATPAPPLMLSV